MGDILTGTPPELTFLHPLVREAWSVMWGVASGALVVILAWLGITLIVSEHLGPVIHWLAGDGAEGGAGSCRCRILPLVVRPRDSHRGSDLRLHSRSLECNSRRSAPGTPLSRSLPRCR